MSKHTEEPSHGDAPPEASPEETRDELLRVTGRGYTVIRHILRQLPDDAEHRPSVLGPMVTDRKRRSLQLYLLLLTVWPWLQRQSTPLGGAVWARALSTEKGRRWTPTHVSAAWTDLEERGLIERKRHSRAVSITPRREDGEAAYQHPGMTKDDRYETYFVLPPEFWTDEWFERLSLPALAMLLIIAGETSDKDEVWLTNEGASEWYGLSPRSVEAGIEDLRTHGLLNERVAWVKAPLSPIGRTQRHWYSLTGQFASAARATMQAKASAEVKAAKKPTPRPKKKASKKKRAAWPARTRKSGARR